MNSDLKKQIGALKLFLENNLRYSPELKDALDQVSRTHSKGFPGYYSDEAKTRDLTQQHGSVAFHAADAAHDHAVGSEEHDHLMNLAREHHNKASNYADQYANKSPVSHDFQVNPQPLHSDPNKESSMIRKNANHFANIGSGTGGTMFNAKQAPSVQKPAMPKPSALPTAVKRPIL